MGEKLLYRVYSKSAVLAKATKYQQVWALPFKVFAHFTDGSLLPYVLWYLPSCIVQSPSDGVPDAVYNSLWLVCRYASTIYATPYEYRLPLAAIRRAILVCT